MLYLDQASTSFPKPEEVSISIAQYLNHIGANPERGGYRVAREASQLVYETRKLISNLLAIDNPNMVSFTHNATYAFNILIKGFLKPNDHVIFCSNSHNSVVRPIEKLRHQRSISYDVLPIEKDGEIELSNLEKILNKKTKLVLINHASNVTGVITELVSICSFLSGKSIPIALDITQTAGIVPINITSLAVDFVIGTGHKTLWGPPGVGFFYAKESNSVDTLIEGGSGGHNSSSPNHPQFMPHKFEAGTLNYIGLIGLKASIEYCLSISFEKILHLERNILCYLTDQLSNNSKIMLYRSEDSQKKIPILSFNVKNIDPTTVATILNDKFDIAVRAGLHCAPVCHKSLGTYPAGTVRVSLSHLNTEREINKLVEALNEISNIYE